jgi:hypothetical protein
MGMGPVRVVRILEYEYVDIKTMLEDQARWYVGINGKRTHRHVIIKSATLPPELLDNLPEVEDATD